jgi:hypothetical protein
MIPALPTRRRRSPISSPTCATIAHSLYESGTFDETFYELLHLKGCCGQEMPCKIKNALEVRNAVDFSEGC